VQRRGNEDKPFVISGAKGSLGTNVTNAFLEAGARVSGVSRSIADADFPHQRPSALAGSSDTPTVAASSFPPAGL
jgi:nucleoside-diphosphate-sugar epimerase